MEVIFSPRAWPSLAVIKCKISLISTDIPTNLEQADTDIVKNKTFETGGFRADWVTHHIQMMIPNDALEIYIVNITIKT